MDYVCSLWSVVCGLWSGARIRCDCGIYLLVHVHVHVQKGWVWHGIDDIGEEIETILSGEELFFDTIRFL